MTLVLEEQPAVTATVVCFERKVFPRRAFQTRQLTPPTPYPNSHFWVDRVLYIQRTGVHALGEAIANCIKRRADVEINCGHRGVKRCQKSLVLAMKENQPGLAHCLS